MSASWKALLDRVRPKKYGRKTPLILINGLAEQQETWYRNARFWGRFFEVHQPNLMAYEGEQTEQEREWPQQPGRRPAPQPRAAEPGVQITSCHSLR